MGPPKLGPASLGGGMLGSNGLPVPGMQGNQGAQGGATPHPGLTPAMIQQIIAHLTQRATQPVAMRAPGATG